MNTISCLGDRPFEGPFRPKKYHKLITKFVENQKKNILKHCYPNREIWKLFEYDIDHLSHVKHPKNAIHICNCRQFESTIPIIIVDKNDKAIAFYIPRAIPAVLHETLYRDLLTLERDYPTPWSEDDKRHKGKDGQPVAKMAKASGDAWEGEPSDNPSPGVFKFGISGVWHFGFGEIINSISGSWINSKKHNHSANMPYAEGVENFIGSTSFQGTLQLIKTWVQLADGEVFEKAKKAFAAVHNRYNKFWLGTVLKQDVSNAAEDWVNDWCAVVAIVKNKPCNPHWGKRDAWDFLCGMTGIGKFTARVCLQELNMCFPYNPRDMLWLRSRGILHQINNVLPVKVEVEGGKKEWQEKRFNIVTVQHERIFEQCTLDYNKLLKCAQTFNPHYCG
ncbi:hypothetical protein HK097_005213 [Rhizophlyctis rosea]|uniref:Uncharacterized protein n=1 Tax=Rhizophlyctis rosea TaxID=64517 RepID=A0AAD5X5L9_9FUNG|nr:hypothetical protein HK097_005213 [Rhizophlyctis rosea]